MTDFLSSNSNKKLSLSDDKMYHHRNYHQELIGKKNVVKLIEIFKKDNRPKSFLHKRYVS